MRLTHTCGDLLNSVGPVGSFTEACVSSGTAFVVLGGKEIKSIRLFALPGIQACSKNHVSLVEAKGVSFP